jgi:sulfate/thiosulfate transport system substrate-binding protein
MERRLTLSVLLGTSVDQPIRIENRFHDRRMTQHFQRIRAGGVGRLSTLALLFGLGSFSASARDITLLNASFDPTREFYREYNAAFARHWKESTGDTVSVKMSNGGSGKQARSVIEGLDADVVTLALAYDIDAISRHAHLLPADWPSRFPSNSVPYTAPIVFLVRHGNPKAIHDWPDLVRDQVTIVTPNPKTGGGARWNYLAAYGWALRQPGGSQESARAFVKKLYAHVKSLDSGARGSTTTFVNRGVGDVLITWENEARLLAGRGPDGPEIVVPSETIQAEPPVAVVDLVAKRHGVQAAAEGYLAYLYSDEGQELAVKYGFRPVNRSVADRHAGEFPAVKVFTIAQVFGGWERAQPEHFANGGVFDQLVAH